MTALTSKDGDLLSHFDKIDESEAEMENTSPNNLLISNHDLAANIVKIKGHLPLERIIGFCRLFKNVTKQLGFLLSFKTADLQNIFYATLADDIKVSFDNLFLYVPIFIPDAQTQIKFSESTEKILTFSFDSWSTDRKTVKTLLEYQVDIGNAQNINSPKKLIVAHQLAARKGTPNKAENITIFDKLNVRNYHVDIDGACYPRDCVIIDYASNDYLDQYRELKLIFKECVEEELLNAFVSYTDLKNKYSIQIIDLRFQVDRINPKKNQLFEENRGATKNARLFMRLMRHRENKMVSDGNKNTEVSII